MKVEDEFIRSIGNEACTIHPIEGIHEKLCLIENEVLIKTIITDAHALSESDKLGFRLREGTTNPDVTVPESFIPKTKSQSNLLKEHGTHSVIYVKEFQKPAEYCALSLECDHAFTMEFVKSANKEETLTGANLALLLNGNALTLEELQFPGECDPEMMIPMGIVYKIHGRRTAEHFVAGKLMRITETTWQFYINDSMGIRKNKGDNLDSLRPWVHVTTEMANRPYDDEKMPDYLKLEIAFVLYMEKEIFRVMSMLYTQDDIASFETKHVLSHQMNGCPVEVTALLLSQLDWRMFILKSGIYCHVGPYLPSTVGEATVHSIRHYPDVWAQNVLMLLGLKWCGLDENLEDLFELLEEHVLVNDNEGETVKYSRATAEGFDVIFDNLFLLVSGFTEGRFNGERVKHRSFCGTQKNIWYDKIDMTSQVANLSFTQFVFTSVRLVEHVFFDPDDITLACALRKIFDLGKCRADSILLYPDQLITVENEHACLKLRNINKREPGFFVSLARNRFLLVSWLPFRNCQWRSRFGKHIRQ